MLFQTRVLCVAALGPISNTLAPAVPPIARVIVGLHMSRTGAHDPNAIQDMGASVAARLIRNCGVSKDEVHIPVDRLMGRRGAALDPSDLGFRKQRDWDRPRFADYDGVWCDRLMLGEPPVRAAVLIPQHCLPTTASTKANSGRTAVPTGATQFQPLVGVTQALQASPQLAPEDVLLCVSTPALAHGRLALTVLGSAAARSGRLGPTVAAACGAARTAIATAIAGGSAAAGTPEMQLAHENAALASLLLVGCGDDLPVPDPPQLPAANDQVRGAPDDRTLDRAALVAAAWCTHPDVAGTKLCAVLNKTTAGSDDLLAQPFGGDAEPLMQFPMMSDRARNILAAEASGDPAVAKKMVKGLHWAQVLHEAAKIREAYGGRTEVFERRRRRGKTLLESITTA
jgi:hypothetical protein